MPFAGFKDFPSCQRSMEKKYKNPETAKKVCGKLQAQKESSAAASLLTTESQTNNFLDKQKVEVYKDEKGDLFVKLFLLDDSVNVNDWGVTQRSIPQKIGSAVNKPAVLYIDKGNEPDAHIHKRKEGMANHPVLAISSKGETKEHAYLNQELNRVGNIDEVVRNPTNGWWYGIIRITDKGVREAFDADPASLPFFTSSSIWNNNPPMPRVVLDAAGNPVSIERPDETQIDDWEFMHVAFVDEPAYGVQKTQIAGRCTGDSNKCVMHLRNASISANNGETGCGFCTKGAMQKIAQSVREQGLEEVVLGNTPTTPDTSRKSFDTQKNSVAMSVNENSEKGNEKTTEKKVVEEKTTEQNNNNTNNTTQTQQPQQNQNSPAEKKAQVDEPNQQLAASLIEKLSNENSQLKTLLETQQTLTKTTAQRLAAVEERLAKEEENRTLWELSNVVRSSKIHQHLPIEEQEKLVQKYAAAKMTPESLREFIAPFETVNPTQYTQSSPAVTQKVASSQQQDVPSKLDYPAAAANQKVASSDGSVTTTRKPKFMMISEHLKEVGI
jgi:hypothetical protein